MLRDRRLLALLAAEIVSGLGSYMSFLAIPWFVLVTTGSAAQMGIVLAAEIAPIALLGIPSGTLVSRIGARTTMWACDLARAPIVSVVRVTPVATLADTSYGISPSATAGSGREEG